MAILIGFGVLVVFGLVIFSAYRGSSVDVATVNVWGTIPSVQFERILTSAGISGGKQFKVVYTEKNTENFDKDFIEALAAGNGPDLFMLPSDKIITHRNKIFPIPYDVFTQRQFKDSFIEGAEIYMSPEGILGLPVYEDPLVMYWNRTLFTNARLTTPPKYWDEFYNIASLISKKDGALNINTSAVAFGEYANITNAKAIISNLVLQAGNPLTSWQGSRVTSVMTENFGRPSSPSEAAVNFYTEFSNPAKSSYSWNRSLANSSDYFLSGDLALYFGFASEAPLISVKNPNLNFDVAAVPTSREGGVDVSFAKFNAFAIAKASKNPSAAFSLASIFSSAVGGDAISSTLGLAPVRRDLLAKRVNDPHTSIFYDSAIRSRAWLDPNPTETDAVFKSMIESITSGRARTSEAVSRANREISNLLGS